MNYKLSDGITQSMLQSFLSCRQRSLLQLDLWEPILGGSSSAARGDLYHSALEAFHNSPSREVDIPAVYATWLEVQKKKGPIDALEVDDAYAFLNASMPVYVDFWKASDDKLTWDAGSAEKVFDVKWNGYRLRGKIDGLPRIKKDFWVFETKTKSAIEEESMLEALAFDFQNMFYMTCLKAIGQPAVGVIYNIIRKPQLRQKKTETPDELSIRIAEDIESRPDHYFKRYEIAYSPESITRFESELLSVLQEFQKWLSGEVPTYRNQTACITRIKCTFLAACSSNSMAGYRQSRILFRELLP